LQDYDFEVRYIPGESNAADFFSRYTTASLQCIDEITDQDKEEILNEYHIVSGHGSKGTMHFLLKGKFNWDHMAKDIEEFVKKCQICAKAGSLKQNTQFCPIISTRPNELWEIDLIGPLERSDNGHRYILVAIDHYTKWTETAPINDKTADTVVKIIKRLIIDKHGIPETILSDNGTEFQNQEMTKLCKELNIKAKFSSPEHHETVGAVERVNQTLMNKVRKLSKFGQIDWPSVLDAATYATNISFNRSIQTSPFIFVKQETPEFKSDQKYLINKQMVPYSQSNERRNRSRAKYEDKSIRKGNKSCFEQFEIGQDVMIFKKRNSKLDPNWYGGYKIVNRASDHAFWVRNEHHT
ncbi:putative transposable element, partial [Pseudoloma neurophilia]